MNQSIDPRFDEPGAPVLDPSPQTRQRQAIAWVNVALGVAVLVAIGGVAFAAGRLTAPTPAFAERGGFLGGDGFPGNGTVPSFAPGQGGIGPGGLNGGFGGAGGGLTIEGTIESVDADSMTIRMASGQSIEIALDGDTTYHAQTNATAGDVASGGSVIVRLELQRGSGTGGNATASDVTVVTEP